MSLGTKKWRYRYRLKKLIDEAVEKDIVVVSAASNDGKKSYPAYFRNVIGVKSNNIHLEKTFYYKRAFYYAPGTVPKNVYPEGRGNSFAAAYITGYIAKAIYDRKLKGNKQVSDYLKTNMNFLNKEGMND